MNGQRSTHGHVEYTPEYLKKTQELSNHAPVPPVLRRCMPHPWRRIEPDNKRFDAWTRNHLKLPIHHPPGFLPYRSYPQVLQERVQTLDNSHRETVDPIQWTHSKILHTHGRPHYENGVCLDLNRNDQQIYKQKLDYDQSNPLQSDPHKSDHDRRECDREDHLECSPSSISDCVQNKPDFGQSTLTDYERIRQYSQMYTTPTEPDYRQNPSSCGISPPPGFGPGDYELNRQYSILQNCQQVNEQIALRERVKNIWEDSEYQKFNQTYLYTQNLLNNPLHAQNKITYPMSKAYVLQDSNATGLQMKNPENQDTNGNVLRMDNGNNSYIKNGFHAQYKDDLQHNEPICTKEATYPCSKPWKLLPHEYGSLNEQSNVFHEGRSRGNSVIHNEIVESHQHKSSHLIHPDRIFQNASMNRSAELDCSTSTYNSTRLDYSTQNYYPSSNYDHLVHENTEDRFDSEGHLVSGDYLSHEDHSEREDHLISIDRKSREDLSSHSEDLKIPEDHMIHAAQATPGDHSVVTNHSNSSDASAASGPCPSDDCSAQPKETK